jgi:anaerobic selenocysteine-containing dehydrogenase
MTRTDRLKAAIAAEVLAAVEAGVADLGDLTIEAWLNDIELAPRPDYSRALQHGVQPVRRACLTCSWPMLSYGDHHRVCGVCKEGRAAA